MVRSTPILGLLLVAACASSLRGPERPTADIHVPSTADAGRAMRLQQATDAGTPAEAERSLPGPVEMHVSGSADAGFELWLDAEVAWGRPVAPGKLPAGTAIAAKPLGRAHGEGVSAGAFEVDREGMDGGVERDLELWTVGPGALTRPLERGPPGDCTPQLREASPGTLELRSCLDGRGKTEAIGVAGLAPQVQVDAAEVRTSCAGQRGAQLCAARGPVLGEQTVFWRGPGGLRSGVRTLTHVDVVDGPFFEPDGIARLAVRNPDGGVGWRVVRPPRDWSKGRAELPIVQRLDGNCMDLSPLSTGAIYVTTSGCTEFTGSRPGVIVFPPVTPDEAGVVEPIDSGSAQERNGFLVVEGSREVCGDGDPGGPCPLPPGATVTIHDGASGAFEVRRVVVVDLRTRARVEAPWDTHSPTLARSGNLVVFVRDVEVGKKHEVLVWTLGTDERRSLGVYSDDVELGAKGDTIRVVVGHGARAKTLSIDGTTGQAVELAGPAHLERPRQGPRLKSLTLEPDPRFWSASDGRAILAQDGSEIDVGYGGTHVAFGLLITPRAVYRWPKGLRTLDGWPHRAP